MKNGVNVLLAAGTAAIMLLAASSSYSAWISSTNHSRSCARGDLILDAVEKVIQLATTPPADSPKLTPRQVQRITDFEAAAFKLIDRARC